MRNYEFFQYSFVGFFIHMCVYVFLLVLIFRNSYQRPVPALIHYTSFQTTNEDRTGEVGDESQQTSLTDFNVDVVIDHNYSEKVNRRPKPNGKPFFVRGRRPSEEYRQQGTMATIDELNEAE